MELIRTNKLSDNWKSQIRKLWNNEYPEKLSYNSVEGFEAYLKNLVEPSHILLVDTDKNLIKRMVF